MAPAQRAKSNSISSTRARSRTRVWHPNEQPLAHRGSDLQRATQLLQRLQRLRHVPRFSCGAPRLARTCPCSRAPRIRHNAPDCHWLLAEAALAVRGLYRHHGSQSVCGSTACAVVGSLSPAAAHFRAGHVLQPQPARGDTFSCKCSSIGRRSLRCGSAALPSSIKHVGPKRRLANSLDTW